MSRIWIHFMLVFSPFRLQFPSSFLLFLSLFGSLMMISFPFRNQIHVPLQGPGFDSVSNSEHVQDFTILQFLKRKEKDAEQS